MRAKVFIFFLWIVSCGISAGQDVAGSRDHPALSRYPGSRITHYRQKDFDSFTLLTCNPQGNIIRMKECGKQTVGGKVTRIQYAGPREKSALEIFNNYLMAVKKAGFEILCKGQAKEIRSFLDKTCGFWDILLNTSENPADHYYFSAVNPARDLYLSVYAGGGYSGRPPVIAVAVVEKKQMETGLVTARDMKEALERSGHLALYGIYFEYDKADLKPASDTVLAQIAILLRENPDLRIYVVGHTDSRGSLSYNLDLSKRRAEAVVTALTERYGIDPQRLAAYGAGPLCPVASNKTETGRARNRRVEIVKR